MLNGGVGDKEAFAYLPCTDEVTEAMLANPHVRDGVTFLQVHPTFLYESLWNLILLIVMLTIIMRGRKRFDGEIACLYLLGYGMGRFWIEGIRTDRLMIPGTVLPVSQVISGLLAAAGAVLLTAGFAGHKKKHRKK